MPLYDYRCTACGREVEVMHGIHVSGPTACEACGGRMSKLLSPPTIHFKGSGWAKKDAAAGAKKATSKGSSSTSKSDASREKGARARRAKSKASAGESTASSPSTSAGKAQD